MSPDERTRGLAATTVTAVFDGFFSGMSPRFNADGWGGARAPFPLLPGFAVLALLALFFPDFSVNCGLMAFGSPEWPRTNCNGRPGATPPMSTWVGILFILIVLIFPGF